MLRVVFVFLLLASPAMASDMDICRDRQAPDAKARLDACERVIAEGKTSGKDLALALFARGSAAMDKRDNDKAIVSFSAALDADHDNVVYLNWRGMAYERKGDDDHAMSDYNQALKLRSNFGAVYNNRGLIYFRKRALQSALDDLNVSVKYQPKVVVVRLNRARILTATKDFSGALADLTEAARIDPASPQIAGVRCLTYTAMGKYDDAIADCNSVIEKSPRDWFTLNSRAEAYLGKGDLDAALKDFNYVLNENPNNPRAHAGRGQVFEKQHDLEQARADYRAASFALTPYDNFYNAVSRQSAQERLAALTLPPPNSQVSRRVALIIGNGAYKNVHQLDNPPRDAKLIASALRDVGFQTVTMANDLTRDKFFEALHAFEAEAEKADWAVVYYAGHGLEIGGVNYLVPVDAKLSADKDAEAEAVALEQVIAAVGSARKLRLVLLDACRDNPFAPTMQRTIALKLVDKGLSNIEPGAGFMVVYAAKHGETALDGDGIDSPFATALAHDIRQPHVEVRKLFDIVRDDVWATSKHQQQPFTYGSPPGREDFYFVAGK